MVSNTISRVTTPPTDIQPIARARVLGKRPHDAVAAMARDRGARRPVLAVAAPTLTLPRKRGREFD